MKTNELRAMSVADLQKELGEKVREQFNLRMHQSTGQMSHFDQFSKVRKDIARIKTLLNEKANAGDAA